MYGWLAISVFVDVLLQLSQGRFDVLSALVGAVIAVLIGFLIYRFRNQLGSARGLVRERSVRVQTRAMRGHEARYRDSVVEQANHWHVAGHLVPLERIAVEPRFLLLPRPYDPRDEAAVDAEEEIEGPYGLIPLVMDFPQMTAVYGLPGTDIPHLLRDAPGIALLGTPGSGRSTALALIAMLVARQTRVDEMGGLRGVLRIPILFHLADVNFSPEVLHERVDPAELLTQAVLKRMTGGGARSAPGIIPPAMATGVCLVLIDGWDELPTSQREQTLAWLRALISTYPENQFVMAAPARGYHPLVEIGMTPVFLRPWTDYDYEELAVRWAEAWPEIEGSRREQGEPPAPDVIGRVARGNRSRTPLDVTLKAWAAYSGDEKETGRRGWYDAYIDRVLPVPQAREALERMAAEGVTARMDDGETMLGRPDDEVKAFLDASLAKAGRLAMDTPDFLHEITVKTPVLVERTGSRYAFMHPLIESYLAAEEIASSGGVNELREMDGHLEVTLPFLAAAMDVSPWAAEQMNAEPQVLYDHLIGVAAWTGDASEGSWQDELLRRLAQALLSPSQFPVVRQRVLAALVASRDPQVAVIFRQGLQAANPLARMLSVLGMGAFGSPDLVDDIASGLDDMDVSVQAAAALALGATPGEEAQELLVQLLFEGNESVRRAVAESLAQDPELGHQLLREAVYEEDVLVRRAAIFGLTRIDEPWVLEILEDRQIEDDQWFVRDAAREALERHETDTFYPSPQPIPMPDELGWLISWAGERGESVPPGPQAMEVLIKALQEGDEGIRYAAADALGKLGDLRAVKPLYAALRDSSPIVREGAYESLARISQAENWPLPSVL